MDRDDAAGEVAVLYGGEARLLEFQCQFLLVGPGDDGLGEVFAGFGLRRLRGQSGISPS